MTIADMRRIHSSLQCQSLPLLVSQIVEKTTQIDHSVKAVFCRANQIDAYNHKKVRFEINVDNNDKGQFNNKMKGKHSSGRDKNSCGVGLCMSGFEFRN